jgi:DNA-directed RNA polymerase specialized sigma24 family protein
MDARERFERTRKARKRLDEVQALIMYDCDDWKPPGIKAHNEQSDPTAKRAIYNVDELAEKLTALRAEERELTQLIGESLVIIRAVRDGMPGGDKYADMLDARFINDWSFSRIAEEFDIAKSTAKERVDVALDWIDGVGVSRLLRGEVDV